MYIICTTEFLSVDSLNWAFPQNPVLFKDIPEKYINLTHTIQHCKGFKLHITGHQYYQTLSVCDQI